MKCLWLHPGRLGFRTDVPAPVAGPGEVGVRVLLAGICSTDAALVDGMYGFTGIPGHEFVGIATEGPREFLDHRVVGEINIACGTCCMCRRGDKKHCGQRKALGIRNYHGAFAEFMVLPTENLHLVPDGVSEDAAVFTEPLAAALDVLEQIKVNARDRVLVVGDGKLGQLVCRIVALTGATVDVVGHHSNKLKRLDGIVANTYLRDDFDAGSYDVAVECTGNPTGLSTALDSLRPRGTLIIKSTFPATVEVDTSRIVIDELRLVGSRCGPFEKALSLLGQGRVDPLPLIDERYPLDDAVEAIEQSRKRETLKIILEMA